MVGDFISNWQESIKAVHKGGSKYEAELRLRHGKYVFYFYFFFSFLVHGKFRLGTCIVLLIGVFSIIKLNFQKFRMLCFYFFLIKLNI